MTPVGTIKVVDVLSAARDLVQQEEARNTVMHTGKYLYNMVISELYSNLTQLADFEDYREVRRIYGVLNYKVYPTSSRRFAIPVSVLEDYVTLVSVSMELPSKMIEFTVMSHEDFNRHTRGASSKLDKAISPFDTSGIACVGRFHTPVTVGAETSIVFSRDLVILVGENVPEADLGGTLHVTYVRKPALIPPGVSDLSDILVDAQDKYYDLIVLRIASLVELQNGITDRALIMAKMAYETMFAGLEPNAKARLMSVFEGDNNANRN